jgi:hypothetical protein
MRNIVSGNDIERWLSKTVKAMAASGNLARGKERLSVHSPAMSGFWICPMTLNDGLKAQGSIAL